MDTRIYVMTHKQITDIPDEMYIPLQVGRECRESLGYMADNTGDHISGKNASYCELTGIYWLWKNVDCDIIGVCHYRRFFTRNEKLLDKTYVEQTIERYPMIIPNSSCVKERDAYQHYAQRHNVRDLGLCRSVIGRKYPQYLPAFDYAMDTILISFGNMWITRKEIFNRYCSWLFDILFEVEKQIPFGEYDDYQKRVMGFLSERLFRVWLYMQPEAITEENVKLIDTADFFNVEKKAGLVYRYVKNRIGPLVRLYQAGAMQESLAAPLACSDDFDGKIPVWVCWWQGAEKMPDLIRGCIGSLKKNLPANEVSLRLITLENCMEYVTFTEAVIRKFQEGKISYTHLSDLLRAELLYRYGGMWVDATYYVTKPIDPGIFDHSIYTLRFQTPMWQADITKGRWSGNLWYAQKGRSLFRFLMEGLWYYWEVEDKLIDYYLIDYIIAVMVDTFSEIRNELEQCSYAEKTVFELHQWMNRVYSARRVEELAAKSTFHKLNRLAGYRKTNMVGKKTIYGNLFYF